MIKDQQNGKNATRLRIRQGQDTDNNEDKELLTVPQAMKKLVKT
jgi:hypothetical protein